ncbi:hypothetical protein N7495_000492 [Penicillium taxi]|uniref:uncharacterized protein n=1 Tax=Penicillium taxi TaxID=168475 RepID=UPI0025450875|nr:uncharacterized protein N7495_000492 [Penicillium taxi]KAJ5907810.1 hypothetical protein N7495_000492 [Penicillium taxi]
MEREIHGSDFEIAYVSPVLEEDGNRLGIRSPNGRKRRSYGSSEPVSSIDPDGFTNEDFRVGGPYLCTLPAHTLVVSAEDPAFKAMQDGSILMKVQEIMSEFLGTPGGSVFTSSLFGRKSSVGAQCVQIATILVFTERYKLDDKWLNTSKFVWKYLQSVSLEHVTVEIIDQSRLDDGLATSLILREDTIFDLWVAVFGAIKASVDLADVQTIACLRRGFSNSFPAVLVTINRNSQRSWTGFCERIVSILGQYNLGMIVVEIGKDEIYRGMNNMPFEMETSISQEDFEGPHKPGKSLAPKSNEHGSESLGGFLKLKFQNDVWHQFAVTCFHCIIPSGSNSQQPKDRKLNLTWCFFI